MANARTKKMNALQRVWHRLYMALYMALWFNARRRFVRFLLRLGLFPASSRTDSDTMGEYKRLMAQKDDPKPGLVLPDPNAPHAELIRRVRLYAQNGAKALAPLLDGPLPDPDGKDEWGDRIREALCLCDSDPDARAIMHHNEVGDAISWKKDALRAIHDAYNSPWTVIDGEVYEYESDKVKRVVQ